MAFDELGATYAVHQGAVNGSKMASLDFPAYGSLYFADTPIDTSTKVAVKAGFCIGPNCNPTMWNRHPRELELYGGPSSNRSPC
jgi:hypothetical protein